MPQPGSRLATPPIHFVLDAILRGAKDVDTIHVARLGVLDQCVCVCVVSILVSVALFCCLDHFIVYGSDPVPHIICFAAGNS